MKQATLLGVALLVSLIGSYLVWTDDGGDEPVSDVVVLRTTADAIERIVWSQDNKTITVVRETDALGPYLRIEHVDHIAKKPTPEPDEGSDDPLVDGVEGDAAEGGDDDDDAPTPAADDKVQRFTGNDQATEVWDGFAPLYALRELPIEGDLALATYGLDEPEAEVQVVVGGQTTLLELGGEAYGTRDRYARAGGVVYLLKDATMRPLEFASTRLVERRLHPLDEPKITEVTVTRGADTRAFTQRNADDRTKAYWADATTPDSKDVEASTWLGKLFRMRVRDYPLDDALPATTEPVMTVAITGDGATWPVTVTRATVDGNVEYYAEAGFLRDTVRLTKSLAEESVADLDALFDDQRPQEPVEEAPAPEGDEDEDEDEDEAPTEE